MSDAARTGVAAGVSACVLAGWAGSGLAGAGAGLLVGLALCVGRWWRQPMWVWVGLFLRRKRTLGLTEPVTVSNDRASGGVRYQADVAAAAIRVLGKPHQPTVGSTATVNLLDIVGLLPSMHQSLGLTVDSLSVVGLGSRRRSTGDYPRVYDTLLGTAPYAGRRETWVIVRIRSRANAEALQCRKTAATAALAAAQRIAAGLRHKNIRAQVATAEEILGLDERLGGTALEVRNRRWHSSRDDDGWLTTYGHTADDIDSDVLEQVWSLRADGIIQNVTAFPDGTSTATVTVRSPQPPTASPSLRLRTLPGRQALGLAASMCGPRPTLRGLCRGALPPVLTMPIGASGVLLGRLTGGDRFLLPLVDPGGSTRVHIAAGDAVAKRILVRLAAAGERVNLHTRDFQRWKSVRMPGVTVDDQPRPAVGTTVSVLDGTLKAAVPAPRPATIITVGPPELPGPADADVVIAQTGPAAVRVSAAGQVRHVEVDYFRAENCYVSGEREFGQRVGV